MTDLAERIIDFTDRYPEGYGEMELKSAADAALWRALAVERGNLIEWLPVRKNDRVLELGARFGELTATLLKKGAFIDAVDCEEDHRRVLAKRFGELPSYRLFSDADDVFAEKRSKYEWMIINDGFLNETVYRYGLRIASRQKSGSDAVNRLSLLINELSQHLSSRGNIIFITDNKLGLKQFSAPDHRCGGEYFGQISGSFGGRGQLLFSRSELKKVFNDASMQVAFYYPYPDSLFPECVFSDGRLPEMGELNSNTLSDPDTIRMFDDAGAWDSLIRDGMYPNMASTFLCIATSNEAAMDLNDHLLYIKYSSRRKEDYRICTEIRRGIEGEVYIRKRAYDSLSAPHIGRMGTTYERLKNTWEGSGISPAMMIEEPAESLIPYGASRFDYISGEPLDLILDAAMNEGRTGDIYALLDEFRQILFNQAVVPFAPGARFSALFGLDDESAMEHFSGCMSLSITDIDLIPANLIYASDGKYIIDYEWTIEDPVPVGYIWYRFLHYYVEVSRDRREYFGKTLYRRYDISEEEEALYQWMEESFQQFVKGDREPMYVEISRFGDTGHTLSDLKSQSRKDAGSDSVEVFAYKDDKYTLVEEGALEKRYFPGQICDSEIRIHVDSGTEQIRLDPADAPGMLLIESVTDQSGSRLAFSSNGCRKLSSGGILFDTDDPMVLVTVNEKVRIVVIRYQYEQFASREEGPAGKAGVERHRRLLSSRIRCASGIEKIEQVSNDFVFEQVRRSLNEDNVLFMWGYYPYENEGGVGLSFELDGMRLDHEVISSPIRLSRSNISQEHMLDLRIHLPKTWMDKEKLSIISGNGEQRKVLNTIDINEYRAKLLCRVDGLIDRTEGVIILGYAAGFGNVEIFAADKEGHTDTATVRKVSRFDINQEIPELSRDAKVGFEIRMKKPAEGSLYPITLTFACNGEEKTCVVNEADFAQKPEPSAWQKLMHYGRRSVEVMQTDGLGEVIRKAKRKLSSRNTPVMSEYEKWCLTHDVNTEECERQREESKHLANRPLFSVVVPLYHTGIDQLKAMIDSVIAQTYDNWELCMTDAGSLDGAKSELTEVLDEYVSKDQRIRYEVLKENLGIAQNTNSAIRMSAGDYIVLLDHDDLLTCDALYECAVRIADDPMAEALYSDQDMIDEAGAHRSQPVMKPDFSIDLLRSRNYISHLFVVKRTIAEEVGLLDPAYDGSQDYDFVLKCTEKAKKTVHIPRVLYHWRSTATSTADDPGEKTYAYEAGKRAIEAHYKRQDIDASVEMTEVFGVYRTTYHYKDRPLVSVIIPNKDHRDDLSRCIMSITQKDIYPNYEIIIVENNSEQPDTFDYYDVATMDPRVSVVTYQGEFNFSAINNFGASAAKGDYLLFMNNDIEEIDGKLIDELMNYAMREDVGVAGARLYYEDETIQHAGIIVGYKGLAGHAFKGFDRTRYGSLDRIICAQDYSAVTAACMMTRKDVFRAVGGFSEELAVAYNDIDYCLKVRRMGKLVAYTPYAIAYHYESQSRGYEDTPEKRARFDNEAGIFRSRWRHIIEGGDPYYNPNLSLDKDDFSLKI